MPAETVADVIAHLTEIIESSVRENARYGYFAALYRRVTESVRAAIEAGDVFEDNARMEKLDVVFANRYLDAIALWRSGRQPNDSYAFALHACTENRPIVLQHLLLCMNAHINLDLGIAAARVAPGGELPALRADFDKINTILASQVDGVKAELTRIQPLLRVFDRALGSIDDVLINFSIEKAREHAWSVAERLAPLTPADRVEPIRALDRETLEIAKLIRYPGSLLSTALFLVRIGEPRSNARIVRILSEPGPP